MADGTRQSDVILNQATETTETDIQVDGLNSVVDSNKEILNDSNNNSANSTSDQPQIILQSDEIITVVVSENISKITREIQIVEDDELKDNQSESASYADKNFPRSILTNNNNLSSEERKSLLRKKSVSFEANEEARKFITGEEIIDKKNPFKNDSDNISDKYRIIKGKKSSIPTKTAPLASEENDFITKEEILKQSKYVPTYIKNPDKVLTYPKPVLEIIKTSDKNLINNGNLNNKSTKKIPVPLPRKTSATKTDKKEKKRGRVRNPKYPDLSDIKVKTGTDLDESLYDPNEVVLNAKKFDSRFKRLQFGSTDDLEEIVDKEETSITVEEQPANDEVGTIKTEEKKSYTNTVNSEEFRQYLKKKGLVLFPIKSNNNIGSTSNGSAKNTNILRQIDETDMSEMDDRSRKKSVLSRLSSIFTSSKGKTTPKTNEPSSRLSYANKSDNNLGLNIKRVILERNNSDNRSVSANSEFMQHFISIDNKKHRNSTDDRSDDNKSSISSVLTAAADDDEDVNTPIVVRRNNVQNGGLNSLYKNIDVSKSKLYQSKVKQNAEPHSNFMNNGNSVKENEDIIKPKVQRPQPNNSSLRQNSIKSLIKPPVPLRRSTERQSMPAMRSGERYKPVAIERKTENYLIPKTPNGSTLPSNDKIKNTSTPSDDKAKMKSPTISPISASQKPSEIDPITFAKIHEIKKKTDEVLLNKSSQLYVRPEDIKLQNNLRLHTSQNFARNSPQRSTITEVYQNRLETNASNTLRQQPSQLPRDDYGYANSLLAGARRSQPQYPPRSQSVLDNMTSKKYSLYDEVKYRRPDGSNVNVMMRVIRPESATIDRNHVMQKIYEYYRKSVNNTPVPFHEQQRNTQSMDISPVSYASVNTMRSMKNSQNGFIVPLRNADYSIDRKGNYFYTSRPTTATMSSTKSDVSRNHTISESDSVFLPENEGGGRNQIKNDTHFVVVNGEKLRPIDVLKMQQQYSTLR